MYKRQNYNCPGQIVISGSVPGIEKACELMKAAGAKRALPLKVGGCLLYTSQACWVALKDVKTLAFDHNLIIKEAMTYIRQFVEFNPSMLFRCV